MRVERHNKLVEFIAKHLVQRKMADVGQEAWDMGSYQWLLEGKEVVGTSVKKSTKEDKQKIKEIMGLTDEVLDALADLVGIEMPPIFMADQPELKVVG